MAAVVLDTMRNNREILIPATIMILFLKKIRRQLLNLLLLDHLLCRPLGSTVDFLLLLLLDSTESLARRFFLIFEIDLPRSNLHGFCHLYPASLIHALVSDTIEFRVARCNGNDDDEMFYFVCFGYLRKCRVWSPGLVSYSLIVSVRRLV